MATNKAKEATMNDIHAKKTARPFTLTVHEVRRAGGRWSSGPLR